MDYLKMHPNDTFAFVHNHNTDGSFSETDIRTLLTTEQFPIMIAVRDDGVIYVATRKGHVIKTSFYDNMYN